MDVIKKENDIFDVYFTDERKPILRRVLRAYKKSLSNKYVNDKWHVKTSKGTKIRLKEKSSRGQTVFNSYVNFRLIF